MPGVKPGEITSLSSHLDIVPTLLPLLGVKSPAAGYCLGHNLLSDSKRTYTVAGDWSRLCYIDEEFKAVFPFSNRAMNHSRFTTRDDRELADPDIFWSARKEVMVRLMKELNMFQTHYAQEK